MISVRWQARCDDCGVAWAYPEGDDPETWLESIGWRVEGGRHVCPRCARRP